MVKKIIAKSKPVQKNRQAHPWLTPEQLTSLKTPNNLEINPILVQQLRLGVVLVDGEYSAKDDDLGSEEVYELHAAYSILRAKKKAPAVQLLTVLNYAFMRVVRGIAVLGDEALEAIGATDKNFVGVSHGQACKDILTEDDDFESYGMEGLPTLYAIRDEAILRRLKIPQPVNVLNLKKPEAS